MVKVETIAQKNICHMSFKLQNEETSSMENSNPPIGAPKAEATPAAAPALTKLRLQIIISFFSLFSLYAFKSLIIIYT